MHEKYGDEAWHAESDRGCEHCELKLTLKVTHNIFHDHSINLIKERK